MNKPTKPETTTPMLHALARSWHANPDAMLTIMRLTAERLTGKKASEITLAELNEVTKKDLLETVDRFRRMPETLVSEALAFDEVGKSYAKIPDPLKRRLLTDAMGLLI